MRANDMNWTCFFLSACGCAAALLILAGAAHAEIADARRARCTTGELAAAVDEAGSKLRSFNNDAAPELRNKVHLLGKKKGWPEKKVNEMAVDYLQDREIAAFDSKANKLLGTVDRLGRVPEEGEVDCARINDVRAAGQDLLAVMKAKTTYTLAKIDRVLDQGDQSGNETKSVGVAVNPNSQDRADTPGDLAERSHTKQRDQATQWRTETQLSPPREERAANTGNGQVANLDSGLADQSPNAGERRGYTIEEIRDATRGFFGTISTNLATVLEHAFRKWGEPTAYVLGKEGGGAFLAGLRYGKGTMFLRDGRRRRVYWHGPSVGTDIGASGSRTMFLIYGVKKPKEIYRSFTGVDGSAYFVGGVGLTLLKGGDVVMAPIRTGLGLRLGANIGYVRFTPDATWNPF